MTDSRRGPRGLDRRSFLRGTAATGLGLSLLPLAGRAAHAALGPAADGAPRVRRRVTLGRTGLEVPDIGFGSSRLGHGADAEALVRHALDRGITYFDTAESYTGGSSEETLGRALQGVREQVVLATKVKCERHDPVERLMGALEASLTRLRTDRVEIYFNHAVNDLERLKNPAWGEFVERAKEQGKIRFTGMSGHGGHLVECVDHALDHDLFDVLLLAHNFGQDPAFYERFTASFDFVAVQPDLPRVLAKARRKDVGVVAMKTLRGARLNDLRPYEREGGTFAQAAFRWVLSRPHTDCLVVTMKSPERVDEYLGASGTTRVTRSDLGLLALYEQRNGRAQCRYGCDACASACPEGVPIADVLRHRMYDEDYGDPALAREGYAALARDAAACAGCAHQACAGACPHGIDIAPLTSRAHARLGGPGGPVG